MIKCHSDRPICDYYRNGNCENAQGPCPKEFVVTFSYQINVNAEDKEVAEYEAKEIWGEIMPRADEMSIEVEEE